MRLWVPMLLMTVAVLLVGCGGVEGQAEPVGDPAFHPCDDIPDEVIARLGLDPSTEEREILGVKQYGGWVCGWSNGAYEPSLGVFALSYTMLDIENSESNEDFEEVDIAGRSDAIRYRDIGDVDRSDCDVAFGSGVGAVIISVLGSTLARQSEDPCEVALRWARELNEVIPE